MNFPDSLNSNLELYTVVGSVSSCCLQLWILHQQTDVERFKNNKGELVHNQREVVDEDRDMANGYVVMTMKIILFIFLFCPYLPVFGLERDSNSDITEKICPNPPINAPRPWVVNG